MIPLLCLCNSVLFNIQRAIVANVKLRQVDRLVKALERDYYIDAEMITDAIDRSISFNLIHLETMIKIDVFIVKGQPYDSQALARRQSDTLDEASSRRFYLSSPEDIILSKLQWYPSSGEISRQQWKARATWMRKPGS